MTAMPPPLARAALFDLDGTLMDTAPDMAQALNRLRAECDLASLPQASIRCEVSHGSLAVVRLGFPDAGEAQFERLRARFLALYGECLTDQSRLFDGFDAVLATLDDAGIPWGVVTNKPGWLTDPLLAAAGLARRAACVVAGDSLPERKPHPRPLLVAAGLLDVPPQHCVYVGDAQRDIDAARAAGMLAVGVRFGYLRPTDTPDQWQANCWIDRPAELLPLLALGSPMVAHADG